MLDFHLKKNGVKHFLHHSFAWFGERSSFIGMAIMKILFRVKMFI